MKDKIRCKNNFGKFEDVPKEKFVFRPSVYAFIKKGDEVLTLTNKSNGKYWFPGGGMQVGEVREEALRREVREETGLKIEIQDLVLVKENFFYYQPLDEAYHAFLFFYKCSLQDFTQKLIKDSEVDDLESKKPRWTPISNIQKQDIGDLEEAIWNALQIL